MKKQIFILLLTAIVSFPVSSQVIYLNSNLPQVLKADAGQDNFIDLGDSAKIGGYPAALDGYGNYTYYWEPSTGVSDPTVANPWIKPNETTTYILTVSDGHHCLAMDEVIVKVGASGLDEATNKLEINVYPNPANDFVNILIKGHSGRVDLKIVNSLGQGVLMKEAIQQSEILFNINTWKWKKGVYYLIVQTPEKVEVQTIIIL